jgi:hypothetical protein
MMTGPRGGEGTQAPQSQTFWLCFLCKTRIRLLPRVVGVRTDVVSVNSITPTHRLYWLVALLWPVEGEFGVPNDRNKLLMLPAGYNGLMHKHTHTYTFLQSPHTLPLLFLLF